MRRLHLRPGVSGFDHLKGCVIVLVEGFGVVDYEATGIHEVPTYCGSSGNSKLALPRFARDQRNAARGWVFFPWLGSRVVQAEKDAVRPTTVRYSGTGAAGDRKSGTDWARRGGDEDRLGGGRSVILRSPAGENHAANERKSNGSEHSRNPAPVSARQEPSDSSRFTPGRALSVSSAISSTDVVGAGTLLGRRLRTQSAQ